MFIRTKLILLLVTAMTLLAGTRGVGLIQLGAFLDRFQGYTASLDEVHLQIEAAQASHIAELRAGRGNAASEATHEATIRDLRGVLQAKHHQADATQQRERSLMYVTYVIMLVLVFVVCGSIYWLLMKTIVRPLQGMAAIANRVAAGDLTRDIEVRNRDEIGMVMQALRDMTGGLGILIGKIRGVSQSLGGSTEQIASASASLSAHVQVQTDFLQKTAATLRELAAAVNNNADNATRARANSRPARVRSRSRAATKWARR